MLSSIVSANYYTCLPGSSSRRAGDGAKLILEKTGSTGRRSATEGGFLFGEEAPPPVALASLKKIWIGTTSGRKNPVKDST